MSATVFDCHLMQENYRFYARVLREYFVELQKILRGYYGNGQWSNHIMENIDETIKKSSNRVHKTVTAFFLNPENPKSLA